MLTAAQKAQYRWHDRSMDNEVIAAFNEYQLSQRLSPKTVSSRESLLRGFTRATGIPVTQATPRDLRAHIGRTSVKPGTARAERNAFRAFYDFAIEDGYLTDSPADKLPVVKVPRGMPRPFTLEQIDRLLNSGAYKRTRAMIMLGYLQGFRVAQISRVNGQDIDLHSQTITTVAKGGKERVLPLHPSISELAEHMPRTGWWFPARRDLGGHISAGAVSDLIARAIKRAGITDPLLTPHSLRHTFGTQLVEAGVDIRVVQELMLHESLTSTQIYTQVSEQRKRVSLELLPSLRMPEQATRGETLKLAA